jgi:putative tryptophan/tyrosine transport system substrate-binding protein
VNNRRKLIIALGAGALTAPLGSAAQQPGKVWRVGFLALPSRPTPLDTHYYGGFLRGMRELGYIEGKNLEIEWRFADGKAERLSGLATELVKLNVDAIVARGTPATLAVQKTTTTIPVVMVGISNPVGDGLVKSLARPGNNITGLSNFNADLGPKLLEMLQSMVPKLTRVAVLTNPDNASLKTFLKRVHAASKKIRISILAVDARTAQEIETGFSTITRQNAGAVIIAQEGFFNQQKRQIAELAAKHRLPTITGIREYPEAGGLMSYGQNLLEMSVRSAAYVDKIFKGAKPGDLPVEQPTKLELIINSKTAKLLGLTIPQSLLVMADKVIE